MSHPTPALPQLVSVQVVRAIGISVIIIAHISMAILNTVYPDADTQVGWVKYIYGCRSAIDMFFVFSGFIMVYIANRGFSVKGAAAKFFLFRLTRIIPVYWFYTFLAVALAFFIHAIGLQEGAGLERPSLVALLKSLFFIPYASSMLPVTNVDGITAYPALLVGWTLNYEIFFYIIFAFCMRFTLLKGLLALSAITSVLTIAHTICPPAYVPLYFWTAPVMWKFVIGTWVGYLYVTNVRFKKIPSWLATVFCAVLYAGLFLLYVDNLHPDSLYFHVMSGALTALISAAIVLTQLEQAKAPKFLVHIGDASYATYLSHYFIVVLFYVPFYIFLNPNIYLSICAGILVYALALYCGHLSYLKLELPSVNYFREIYYRRKLARDSSTAR